MWKNEKCKWAWPPAASQLSDLPSSDLGVERLGDDGWGWVLAFQEAGLHRLLIHGIILHTPSHHHICIHQNFPGNSHRISIFPNTPDITNGMRKIFHYSTETPCNLYITGKLHSRLVMWPYLSPSLYKKLLLTKNLIHVLFVKVR